METEGENEVAPCNKKQVRGRWEKATVCGERK